MNKVVFAHDYAAIDAEIERLKPLVELGGYVPCPDHRIPPDARWRAYNTTAKHSEQRSYNGKGRYTQLKLRVSLLATCLGLCLIQSGVQATHHPYTLDQPTVGTYLNEYWNRYGMNEGPKDANGWVDGPIHPSYVWFEWNEMKMAWTNHSPHYRDLADGYVRHALVNGITQIDNSTYAGIEEGAVKSMNRIGSTLTSEQPKGYLWQCDSADKWFDLHYHYDQMPSYICAVYTQ